MKLAAIVAFYIALAVLCALAIRQALEPAGLSSLVPAFLSLPAASLMLSALTVIGAYAALIGIERLSLADVVADAPKLVLTPFVATTLSLGAGFGPVSGSGVRLRLYGPLGVGLTAAIYLATTTTLVLLSGGVVIAAASAGAGFLRLDLPFSPLTAHAQTAGVAITLCILALILFAGRRGRSLTVLKRTLRLPSSGSLFLRTGLAMVNWACTALGLYVLLPEGGCPPILEFVATVSALKLASLMTGSPSGLGVFEALVLSLTKGAMAPVEVTAALIVSRILSFVVPVGLAGIGAAFLEARGNRFKAPEAADGP